jgi:hypothetical protein
MVRTGMVVEYDRKTGTGIIQDLSGVNFFFNLYANVECKEQVHIPSIYTMVTFVRDRDFKSTFVAMLIKPYKQTA